MLSRRDFIVHLTKLSAAVSGGMILVDPWLQKFLTGDHFAFASGNTYVDELMRSAPRARYWTSPASYVSDCGACHQNTEKIKGKRYLHKANIVKCLLCARGCMIENGKRGKCRTRINVDGELKSLVYGRPVSIHIDPIEKKPLYHYLPGSASFSIATAGCPLQCEFCQNWGISQASPEDYKVNFTPPPGIVHAAHESKSPVIAFTYNEPTVFTEYLIDISESAKKQGIRSVMISCGFMNEMPLADICNTLGAIKIDLKGFSEYFYRNVCKAELKPVLRSIKQISKSRVHLEIVNLVVPTLNDSDRMLQELINWVTGEIGPDVPVHFTRFHPDYRLLNLPPTPVATLERARDMALAGGMHYPYVGNVPGHPGNHTYCPRCKKAVIERQGFFITSMNLKEGRCKFCRQKIAGVWA